MCMRWRNNIKNSTYIGMLKAGDVGTGISDTVLGWYL